VFSDEIMYKLQGLADPEVKAGMSRFGIDPENALGVSVKDIRRLAGKVGPSHDVALDLWNTGIHEAKILASMVDVPSMVTEEQMETWVSDLDSWDVCDQVMMNLFDKTPLAYDKAVEWTGREGEFVKRAGFALMAALAVHDKGASEEEIAAFLPVIEERGGDERKYAWKAAGWALRSIGKRSPELHAQAVETAERMFGGDDPSARRIAGEALKELTGKKVRQRLGLGDGS
jgi:3-methyladenine DNA glycosylase AlkD